MMVLNKGHKYLLDNMEGDNSTQEIQFIQKEGMPDGSFSTVQNGTTNEEVLMVLIDRLQHLQAVLPCRENAIVITKLEESLMWLQKRTQDRKNRQVEATNKA